MHPSGQDMKRRRLLTHMAYLCMELSDTNIGDELHSCMEGAVGQNFRDCMRVPEKHNRSLINKGGAFQAFFPTAVQYIDVSAIFEVCSRSFIVPIVYQNFERISNFVQRTRSDGYQITTNFLQNDFICRAAIHCNVTDHLCMRLQLDNSTWSNLYEVFLQAVAERKKKVL